MVDLLELMEPYGAVWALVILALGLAGYGLTVAFKQKSKTDRSVNLPKREAKDGEEQKTD